MASFLKSLTVGGGGGGEGKGGNLGFDRRCLNM